VSIVTTPVGGTASTISLQPNAATNRLPQAGTDVKATYDPSGRITYVRDMTGTWDANFTYDALDSVVTSDEPTPRIHLYTASDERIATIGIAGGGTAGSDWTLRDPSGKVLRRLARSASGTWTWVGDYVYMNGQLVAAEVPTPERTLHFHRDHLGTPRLITNHAGARVGLHTYYAFGREIPSTTTQDAERLKYTGHERDSPELDYMHARYYLPGWGRFLSVDPSPKLRLQQPQSWNRYAYSLNNPLKYVDPDGRDAVVFIVNAGSKWDQKGGHAAVWVESGNRQGGVSRGGYDIGQGGWKGLLEHYTGQGREVHAYILTTTDAQDQAMLDFIDKNSGGGVDANKSIQTCGLTENCASAVVNVLQAGGVVPTNSDPSAVNGANSPFALKRKLDHSQLKSQVQRHIDFVPPPPEKKESWWLRLIDRIF
jgi:RHS repeat-associated protein